MLRPARRPAKWQGVSASGYHSAAPVHKVDRSNSVQSRSNSPWRGAAVPAPGVGFGL